MRLVVGTRGSELARLQTTDALQFLATIVPGVDFEIREIATPGDVDLKTPLPQTPTDFFTQTLDTALLEGKIDFAIHSAKDLPSPMPTGIDWVWLPLREEVADCLVLRKGLTQADFNNLSAPRIGVSSARREVWCRATYPHAQCLPIRGAIPQRLQQLDAGDYDAMVTACAALNRLGLKDRISARIPLSSLRPPAGQGVLAMTFREGDQRILAFRNYLVKAVRFTSAGTGSADFCTRIGCDDLKHADVCLYDELLDRALLKLLPAQAERISVGKRCAAHSHTQSEITELIADYARRGLRVVRLKGGDAGLFGRLAEEVSRLNQLQLPYCVRPGVSALAVATTATGRLLTQRGTSRGFVVETPRRGKGEPPSAPHSRIIFMATKVATSEAQRLLQEGFLPETPCEIVFGAGSIYQQVFATTLGDLAQGRKLPPCEEPGLLLVGEVTSSRYKRYGPLQGRRTLLTCSEVLCSCAARWVDDWGGVPITFPLIQLTPLPMPPFERLDQYDWVVLTSPTAIRHFLEKVQDLRTLPKLMVCGASSAEELARWRLKADLAPERDFSAEGLLKVAEKRSWRGVRILRPKSNLADDFIASGLRALGATVEELPLYKNEPTPPMSLPECEAILFASRSAVEVFLQRYGEGALKGREVVVLGKPTARALPTNLPYTLGDGTLRGTIESLATKLRLQAFASLQN